MKKVPVMIAYWIAAMLVTALILVSLNYDMGLALMMSLAFLPSALWAGYRQRSFVFLPKKNANLCRSMQSAYQDRKRTHQKATPALRYIRDSDNKTGKKV